ncbi:MAG TPA: Nudix family hydrolase [Gammaproteobacteria bacterium]|nr:Nudix family hydrolase [Gammaproteobacteria bacterium]
MNHDRSLKAIHVVAAVLYDAQGRVLIAQRPAGKPLAGFWEFPGGKLERGEMARDALSRELHEELGITVLDARPLLRFSHTYPERHVELDVWRVTRYEGAPHAREQQALAWVRPVALAEWNILPADQPIIQHLRLPPRMLVTPAPDSNLAQFLDTLHRSLESGIELVQLRAPDLDKSRYLELARDVIRICHEHGARIVLNGAPEIGQHLGADGAHLPSRELNKVTTRPAPASFLVGASCHTASDLRHAALCKLDYALLGPVQPTPSHPGAPALGWDGFARLAGGAGLPVFAIGGMQFADLERVRRQGGYGLAAIRGLWLGDYGSR